MDFFDLIRRGHEIGITDVFLPFILFFTVIYAVLRAMKLFGDNKRFHTVIALVLALLIVTPHVINPSSNDVVSIINRAIPGVSGLIVGIVLFMVVLGVFGIELRKEGVVSGVLVLVMLVVVLYIFGKAAGWWGGASVPEWLDFLNDPDTMVMIVMIFTFLIVIWFIVHEPSKGAGGSAAKGLKKFFESIGKEIKE